MKRIVEDVAWTAAAVLASYVLAYFALVRQGPVAQVAGWWSSWPRYLAVPEAAEVCFRPLYQFDRGFFRPGMWEGSYTEAERMQSARAVQAYLDAQLNAK